MKRAFNRAAHQLRPIFISYNVSEYASGSVLFQIGKTKVLCAVSLQTGVPQFLKGKKVGWLNAEYAMLPTATHVRKDREVVACKRNGRSMEISRLISRALRAVVDLSSIGERTITVDCDVLQADGGTRTAAITGSYLALKMAVARWLDQGAIAQDIMLDEIAAISLGVSPQGILLDLDFQEDSSVDADFNFVLTRSGSIIEVQGTADHQPVSWASVMEMYQMAAQGIADIFTVIEKNESRAASTTTMSRPFNGITFKGDRSNP